MLALSVRHGSKNFTYVNLLSPPNNPIGKHFYYLHFTKENLSHSKFKRTAQSHTEVLPIVALTY